MEEYLITGIGLGGHAFLGKWKVKEGFEDSLISTLRDYADTIEVCKGTPWEKTKGDYKVFDVSIRYYPCVLFADYGEVMPNNGFDLLDYTYMKFPIHGEILYEGGDTIYLFCDIVESIIDLFNEYYVGCNEEEKKRKYQQAINALKEWLNSRTSKKYRDDLKKEKILNEYRKNKEYEESHKPKDVAGEQTAPKTANASTTGSVLSEEELEEYGLCDEAIKEIGDMLNDKRIKYKNERLELAYPIMEKWMFGNAPFKVFAYYFPNSIKQTQYNDFMRKKYLETKKNK